jgi:hypothetical protein
VQISRAIVEYWRNFADHASYSARIGLGRETGCRKVSSPMSGHFTAARNRALTFLAETPDGRTKAIMLARGFWITLLDRCGESSQLRCATQRLVVLGLPTRRSPRP